MIAFSYPPIERADPFQGFNAQTTLWHPQNARGLVYASELAYKDPGSIKATADSWGFRSAVIASSSSVLQAIILGDDQKVVLAFRGTEPGRLRDWMADFDIAQSAFSDYFT